MSVKITQKGNVMSALKDFIQKSGSSRNAAKSIGVSESYISDILCGRKPPHKKILSFFGFEKVVSVTYRKSEKIYCLCSDSGKCGFHVLEERKK